MNNAIRILADDNAQLACNIEEFKAALERYRNCIDDYEGHIAQAIERIAQNTAAIAILEAK